jgi:hypothetical protein
MPHPKTMNKIPQVTFINKRAIKISAYKYWQVPAPLRENPVHGC